MIDLAAIKLRVREALFAKYPGLGLPGDALDLIVRETLTEAPPLETRVAELERWRRTFQK